MDMRTVVRVCVILALIATSLMLVLAGWFYFSTSGLPSLQSLQAYAPDRLKLIAADRCVGPVLALPVSEIRRFHPGVENTPQQLQVQIARRMSCEVPPRSAIVRDLNEVRLTMQIRRRFSTEQQEALYLNSSYFGDGQYGIENAAEHYFKTSASELPTADSLLLIGILSRPGYYSPYTHPDRAVVRRNRVIEQLEQEGRLTSTEAKAAESAPLGVK